MDKKAQINFWYIIIAIFGILIIQSMYSQYTKVEPIPYSRFHELLDQGKIAEIAITQNHIYGSLKEKGADGIKDFVTTRVESDLAEQLDKHNVTYTGIVQSTWLRDLLSWILPMAIFIGIWLFLIRRMNPGGVTGGLMAIGKSRAKVFVEKETKVTFDDVAGVEEAKEELVEIINFLKDPQGYSRLGDGLPRASSWLGRRALVRLCWRAPLQVKPGCRSFRFQVRNSSKCSLGLAPPGCETCSSKHVRWRRRLFLSTSWIRWEGPGAPTAWGGTTRRSKR